MEPLITRKQREYIQAREQDIDMAFEYNDLSYLNQYSDEYCILKWGKTYAKMESDWQTLLQGKGE